ncbi:hypothetical protein K501DRAFT_269310 [Backusella circina FSU 941]|nr:hypothetical protein K501DRAFT_269310 [Backusella circina FSU 941]
MGCWDDLKLTLKIEILLNVDRNDLITCQRVSKSFREVAINLFYQVLTLSDKHVALLFLKGQLQAIQPNGGLFVDSLDISGCYGLRALGDLSVIPFHMFATTCPNVQYLISGAKTWQFWMGLRELQPTTHWLQLRCIPFQTEFSQEYYHTSLLFRNSLTNVTIKALPKDFPSKHTVQELFAYIKATYPKVESLEIYQRKIKHIFELDQLTTYFPHLRDLVTGRAKPKFMANPPKDASYLIKHKGPIVPHRYLEQLYLCLPKLEHDSVSFLAYKFPNLKYIKLIYDKVANLLVTDSNTLQLLLKYLISRKRYFLLIPVDCPALLLNEFYRFHDQYFSPHCHLLEIEYGINKSTTARKPIEQYSPNVILKRDQHGSPGVAKLEYIYFSEDEYFLDLTSQLFETVGERLQQLSINMSSGYTHTIGTDLMNGYFLDSLIFYYCKHLEYLRLVYFHLVRCNPAFSMPTNHTIWKLSLMNSRLVNGEILNDLSLRLPNLRQVYLETCIWTPTANVFHIPFIYSHLEQLVIEDTMPRKSINLKWVIVEVENRRKMFGRLESEAASLEMCEDGYFDRHYTQTDYMIYIRYKAILIQEVKAGLNKLSNNLENLHLNLDIIRSISIQFKEPSKVWTTFHNDTVSELGPISQAEEEGLLLFKDIYL